MRADDGARTRHLRLGKASRCQLRHVRVFEPTCKPGSVSRLGGMTAIHLGLTLPPASCGPPASTVWAARPRFDLAPGGVYLAALVTQDAGGLLHRRFTLTPDWGGLLSVALARGSPRADVTGHPDFPQRRSAAAVRPAQSGRRGSNPRPRRWQRRALPAAPRPHVAPLSRCWPTGTRDGRGSAKGDRIGRQPIRRESGEPARGHWLPAESGRCTGKSCEAISTLPTSCSASAAFPWSRESPNSAIRPAGCSTFSWTASATAVRDERREAVGRAHACGPAREN